MHADDDPPPHRPRWLAAALIAAVILIVGGMLTVGWRTLQADRPPQAAALSEPASADTNVIASGLPEDTSTTLGQAAAKNANCMRCHGVERRYVGPAFNQVSARYQGRPDAVDYLVGKIRNGGAGEWGRALMPRQPHVSEEQARQIAGWILSLPPAKP
jgi:cytochrome c551/c552